MNLVHIVCYSGGHSSALVAIEVVRKYGKENVVLLNHDINPNVEDIDIKRFKTQIAKYLGLEITYANINNINNPSELPDQFDVCMSAGAITDYSGHALCTNRLKTQPFYNFLNKNFPTISNLFEEVKECIIYYGFDKNETLRIQRRSSILGSLGYKCDYVLAFWQERTIYSTNEISILPPNTYGIWKHANCKGCLKGSLLHWYVTFCHCQEQYIKGELLEDYCDYALHRVTRNGIRVPAFLKDLREIFQKLKDEGFPATEHQSENKFANKLKKYGLKEDSNKKPCECLV